MNTPPVNKQDPEPLVPETLCRKILLFVLIPLTFLGFLTVDLQLVATGFYDHINLAFDFDQGYLFKSLSYFSLQFEGNPEAITLKIKHPLIYLYGLPVMISGLMGIERVVAIITITLLFHCTTLYVIFEILRRLLNNSQQALLLTLVFISSATYLADGTVLDSYAFALFWITASLWILQKSLMNPPAHFSWARAGVYVMAVGTTSYLLLLVLLCEVIMLMHHRTRQTSSFQIAYLGIGLLKCALIFVALFVLCYSNILFELVSSPLEVAKKTLWAVVRPGEKEGILAVSWNFLVNAMVAPKHIIMEIEPGKMMADFRGTNYIKAVWLINGLLIILYVLALKQIKSPLLQVAIIWTLINIVFHLEYQDRGSLFLYTGHILATNIIWLAYGMSRLSIINFSIAATLIIACFSYNNVVSIDQALLAVLP
ncbi:hypothetical protein NF212_17980 [Parasalinivibrio latis]|uniref:hypothetical protein n=1 Tax=Parasalinivibrio latis TaxID=2952610 RepID=UPI0030E47B65